MNIYLQIKQKTKWVLVKVPMAQIHRATQHVPEWRKGGLLMGEGLLSDYDTESMAIAVDFND